MAYANGGGGGAICPPGGEGVPIRRPPAAVLRFHRRTPPPFTQSLIFIAHPQRRFCPGLSNQQQPIKGQVSGKVTVLKGNCLKRGGATSPNKDIAKKHEDERGESGWVSVGVNATQTMRVRIHFVFPPPRLFLCPSAGAVHSRKDDERKSDGDGVSVIQQKRQQQQQVTERRSQSVILSVVVVAHRLAVCAVIFLGSAAMVGAASGAGGGWDDGGTPKSEPKTPTDRTAAKGGELFSHTHSLVVVGSAAELVG
ncbi:hypothetical protein niasHT_004046 [Heterodera trifolii]|uniref:Uncharacterized protein n=1 Tax=Heterodera trifolii TaxID=157864 RepID=A0ABD2LXQ2_9BILA